MNLNVVKDHIAMARIIFFITKVAFRALAPARVNDKGLSQMMHSDEGIKVKTLASYYL